LINEKAKKSQATVPLKNGYARVMAKAEVVGKIYLLLAVTAEAVFTVRK
jgi:hypothetical protein